MKRRPTVSIITLIAALLTIFAVISAGCSGGSGKAVSGKSVFETPKPSIFDETRTPPPGARDISTPEPATEEPATPGPETPAPPTPPPPTPTPVPPAPTPVPGPQFVTLNLKVLNPDLGTVSVEPQDPANRYEKGASLVLYALPKTGANFKGYSGDVSERSNSLSLTMDSNKNIQVEFAKQTVALVVNPGPGGAISLTPNGNTFDYGTSVTAKAVPDRGYMFKGWTGDASGTQDSVSLTMDRERKIGAEFAKAVYVLNAKADPSGFVDASPDGSRFDGGTVVTLTARAALGSPYRFGSWTGDASGTSPTVSITMDSNKSVIAKFIRQFTLSVFSDSGGTVSPTGGLYDADTPVTLTATPNPGYHFLQWSGQGISGSSPTLTIVMNWDKSATAAFESDGR